MQAVVSATSKLLKSLGHSLWHLSWRLGSPRTVQASLYVLSFRIIWQAHHWIESRCFDCCPVKGFYLLQDNKVCHLYSTSKLLHFWSAQHGSHSFLHCKYTMPSLPRIQKSLVGVWGHDWMNSYSTSWWSLLLIYRPREDERLGWPCWLTYYNITVILQYLYARQGMQSKKLWLSPSV